MSLKCVFEETTTDPVQRSVCPTALLLPELCALVHESVLHGCPHDEKTSRRMILCLSNVPGNEEKFIPKDTTLSISLAAPLLLYEGRLLKFTARLSILDGESGTFFSKQISYTPVNSWVAYA